MEFLDTPFLGTPLLAWGISLVVFAAVYMVAGRLISHVKQKASSEEKTKMPLWSRTVYNALAATHTWFALVLAVYAASLFLTLPHKIDSLLQSAVITALMIQVLLWGNRIISIWTEMRLLASHDAPGTASSATIIGIMAKAVLYTLVLLMILQNLGIQITALVASLGIGSVAIALAIQNILGDLFACLAITLDKPFVIGDFIIVGELLGVVERIGLKTTRLRSLSGEQLIFSNNDLLNSRIRNFKRMYERRVVFGFGVTYQTGAEQLREIPRIAREIIERQENVRFDRAHFFKYGESSLDFEVVYYIKSPDYNIYMDIQQAINLALFEAFADRNISFAYPTRTLYMQPAT